jgi:hypothetical protein
MSIIIIKEQDFKVSTLLSDTTEFVPHGDSICLHLINRTVSVKAEYQGLSAGGSGLDSYQFSFVQKAQNIFQFLCKPLVYSRLRR